MRIFVVALLVVGFTLTGCGSRGSSGPDSGITMVELDSIAITAARVVIPLGETEQLTAQGHSTDDRIADVTRTVTWTSQNPAIASVDDHGLVTVHSVGDTAITASKSGVNGMLTIAVSAAALTGITVTPSTHTIAKGLVDILVANGTFSDGTVADVSGIAIWTTSDAAVATVSTGFVQSAAQGPVTITAAINGFMASATIEVGPPVLTALHIVSQSSLVLIDTDQQLLVNGTWSDHTDTDVSARAVWSVVGSALTISATGVAHGAADGNATVKAQVDDVTGSVILTVETPTRLQISGGSVDTPNVITIAQQQRVPLRAYAVLPAGDGAREITTAATWSPGDPTIVSVASGQVDTPDQRGVAVMNVSAQTRSGVATVTVTIARVSATIEVHVTAETCHPVINEVLAGESSPADEWIELYNPCTHTIDVTGWTLAYHGADRSATDRTLVTLDGSMTPGAFRLYAGAGYTGTGAASADGVWTDSAGVIEPPSFGVGLLKPTTGTPVLVSGVAFGAVVQNPFLVGNPGPALSVSNASGARAPFDGKDSGDNHSDFFSLIPSPRMLNFSL